MGVKVEQKCPVCGVTYFADQARLRHGRQTTCSRTCKLHPPRQNIEQEQDLPMRSVWECSPALARASQIPFRFLLT